MDELNRPHIALFYYLIVDDICQYDTESYPPLYLLI
jgi:hypothetical protein